MGISEFKTWREPCDGLAFHVGERTNTGKSNAFSTCVCVILWILNIKICFPLQDIKLTSSNDDDYFVFEDLLCQVRFHCTKKIRKNSYFRASYLTILIKNMFYRPCSCSVEIQPSCSILSSQVLHRRSHTFEVISLLIKVSTSKTTELESIRRRRLFFV